MLNFENMSRPEMIAARRAIRDNLDTLTAIYNTTRSAGPAETVAQLVERIGKAAAVAVVADLVNATSPADGRISAACHVWAEYDENDNLVALTSTGCAFILASTPRTSASWQRPPATCEERSYTMNKHFFELTPHARRIIWAALLARWQAKQA